MGACGFDVAVQRIRTDNLVYHASTESGGRVGRSPAKDVRARSCDTLGHGTGRFGEGLRAEGSSKFDPTINRHIRGGGGTPSTLGTTPSTLGVGAAPASPVRPCHSTSPPRRCTAAAASPGRSRTPAHCRCPGSCRGPPAGGEARTHRPPGPLNTQALGTPGTPGTQGTVADTPALQARRPLRRKGRRQWRALSWQGLSSGS